MTIQNLSPQKLWSHFYYLTQIPRPSNHEQAVVSHCVEFAKNLSLDVMTDKVGNVIIRKPATPGMESCKTVVLQSHLDMVPQKNADTAHDFFRDPIKTAINGDWVNAIGTTLGADNGIGVAAILAVLESDDIVHGPLEALLTVNEEAGMTGASELEPGLLNADILFNLDTEEEGELYLGCAGGIDVNASWDIPWQSTPADHKALKLCITGLKGGHSGCDIHRGRGNANKIFARILTAAQTLTDIRIAAIQGGSLRNAIPREAFVQVTAPENTLDQFQQIVTQQSEIIRQELALAEPSLSIRCETIDASQKVFDPMFTQNICRAIYGCPNGVQRMSDSLTGVVETSNSLAKIYSDESMLHMECLVRSSIDSAKHNTVNAIESVFSLAGGRVSICNSYPGWTPDTQSPVLALLSSTYFQLFNVEPKTQVIHAGLECGLLGAKYPDWDMISFGPTIRKAHSPDEEVNIPSVKKFWEFLIASLAAVKGLD